MDREEKVQNILTLLKKEYPEIKTALNFREPIQLLVATILSAQCTDERVNKVTKKIFKKYKTASDYANADLNVFEQEIRSTGFFRNKAKNIIGAATLIEEEFDGKVPDKMEELIRLPGVAKKQLTLCSQTLMERLRGLRWTLMLKGFLGY
jgi:endonuclease-3